MTCEFLLCLIRYLLEIDDTFFILHFTLIFVGKLDLPCLVLLLDCCVVLSYLYSTWN